MAGLPRGAAAHPAPPTMARVRVRFAKRGRLRFLSHRDVARAFERAVRRAGVPVSYSHGFSPHPRLSWVGAAPTGAASEAEYVEIGLTEVMPTAELAAALDAALPAGLDILDVVPVAPGSGSLADRIDASSWRVELPGVQTPELATAVEALLAADAVTVQRGGKNGPRSVDVSAGLVSVRVGSESAECAILELVVRQATPAVRPDDVLGALGVVAGLRPPVPAKATRVAQGLLDDLGRLADDPLERDRAAVRQA
jgi:radical SAM-linked protein